MFEYLVEKLIAGSVGGWYGDEMPLTRYASPAEAINRHASQGWVLDRFVPAELRPDVMWLVFRREVPPR